MTNVDSHAGVSIPESFKYMENMAAANRSGVCAGDEGPRILRRARVNLGGLFAEP